MTTATAQAPATSSLLVEPRAKKHTGMLTSGLFVIVGMWKTGKTRLAASSPESYVLELEKGGGDRVAGRIHDITDLATLRQVLPAVMKDPSIKIVVIDTVDKLNDWVEDEIAKSKGLSTISERKAGVDGFELWAEHRKRIEGLITYFKESGKLVVLLAHCKEAKLDGTGTLVTPAGINLPGKASGYVASQADMIGHTYKKVVGGKTEYCLTFQGGPLGAWGSRVDEVNDKTVILDGKNPWGSFESLFAAAEPAPEKKVEKKAAPAAGRKR